MFSSFIRPIFKHLKYLHIDRIFHRATKYPAQAGSGSRPRWGFRQRVGIPAGDLKLECGSGSVKYQRFHKNVLVP